MGNFACGVKGMWPLLRLVRFRIPHTPVLSPTLRFAAFAKFPDRMLLLFAKLWMNLSDAPLPADVYRANVTARWMSPLFKLLTHKLG